MYKMSIPPRLEKILNKLETSYLETICPGASWRGAAVFEEVVSEQFVQELMQWSSC